MIKKNINLKKLNTFGIDVFCDFFVEINSISEFFNLIKEPNYQSNQKLIIGGGSNLLFTKDFKGIVIKNNLKGINLVSENNAEVVVKVGAGENWHDFVMWCLNKNYSGLENLSLIPGCVGASPMQNIGAYGVEIKDVFENLEAYSINDGTTKIFNKNECEFGYRDSIFKRELKNKFLIASVNFRLKKQGILNTSYGAINLELAEMKIINPTIKDVSNAVIRIRKSKLPDPNEIGNAGSFFKNPEISKEKHEDLKKIFNDLVSYSLPNGNFKLAAGWLIEQCGLKGYEINDAAVHTKQALVIVNKKNCKGIDVFNLSNYVLNQVAQKFGVILEIEVNIV